MEGRFDIILFGATGYTGKQCIGELRRSTKSYGRNLTWGIAGRSRTKMLDVLSNYQQKTGYNLNHIPVIEADIGDEASLRRMTSRARVIINCCGPYRFFGERVVRACIETGTHQVDVTGEPGYMEMIQLKYHRVAQEKGVYIVSACGLDSIPSDLGIVLLQKKFGGTLNSVEIFLKPVHDQNTRTFFNYATWESAIHGVAKAEELHDVRQQLFSSVPKLKPKLKDRSPLSKNNPTKQWLLPFVGADKSVSQRTQHYLHNSQQIRPAQIQAYFAFRSVFDIITVALYGSVFSLLVKYNIGRQILLKYPEFFSGGLFTRTPPESLAAIQKLSLILHGQGWREAVADSADQPPDKSLTCVLSGNLDAYGFTSRAVTLSAIMVLEQTEKLPERGGVFTPGAAFADTSLFHELQFSGVNFEIKSKL